MWRGLMRQPALYWVLGVVASFATLALPWLEVVYEPVTVRWALGGLGAAPWPGIVVNREPADVALVRLMDGGRIALRPAERGKWPRYATRQVWSGAAAEVGGQWALWLEVGTDILWIDLALGLLALGLVLVLTRTPLAPILLIVAAIAVVAIVILTLLGPTCNPGGGPFVQYPAADLKTVILLGGSLAAALISPALFALAVTSAAARRAMKVPDHA